ncbi:GNAT family N-acetyltransferase [Undibacterium sp. RuRC25W]|uniref:GNAT family N-acetyltransferase n=1 Tax=Undibacterium sp. RuRC25W TaxID=3413047 RepID=UPI003BF1EAC5
MELTSINQHYRMGIATSLSEIGRDQWDTLLQSQLQRNPFLSYTFLDALHETHCACKATGWQPCFITLWDDDNLVGAYPLYQKMHSYGEYVFDWAWADAYQRYGFSYYPKLLSAIPFTPVTGCRAIARNTEVQEILIAIQKEMTLSDQFSSCHTLFLPQADVDLYRDAGFLIRTGVQFHWKNQNYHDFDEFLTTLSAKKSKNIRAERRKVREQGISFSHISGSDASDDDWHFFKKCYDLTYANHRSTPYLNLAFFLRIGKEMPDNIFLIVAVKDGEKIAASLLIYDEERLYGRYWGCLQSYPCLHFETAYYQAIELCIRKKINIFEGGAQGEHKIARGFLPEKTWSAHLLARPEFSDAVAQFLNRETNGVELYIDELNQHTPYRNPTDKDTPPTV